jgi:hypothetical protein
MAPDSRSQWLRDLRRELSSPAHILRSWVRIPLEAWMSVCLFSIYVVLRVGNGLATKSMTQIVMPLLMTLCIQNKGSDSNMFAPLVWVRMGANTCVNEIQPLSIKFRDWVCKSDFRISFSRKSPIYLRWNMKLVSELHGQMFISNHRAAVTVKVLEQYWSS